MEKCTGLPKVTQVVRSQIQVSGLTPLSWNACSTILRTQSSCKDRKAWVKGYTGDTHHVLVEVVDYHPGQARVTPVAVHKQQLLEVAESGNGKVTGHDGLGGKYGNISFHTQPLLAPEDSSLEDNAFF